MRYAAPWITFPVLLCAACASQWGSVGGAETPTASAPAAAASDNSEKAKLDSVLQSVRSSKRQDYRITPADLIDIDVYRETDLNKTLRVSQNGTIALPLVGPLQVAGLTVAEAEEALEARLQEFILEPHVTVFVKYYANKGVFVMGEVAKPGLIESATETPLSVLEAISMAGGFTPLAAKDRTKVIRQLPDGKSETFQIAVTDITKGDRKKDIRLEPNDVVFIPQTFF